MSVSRLKDLAAATGLHEMTVSRALRDVGRMRPETRQRVLEAARRMDYRPNAAAAAMRTGTTGCIAMLSGAQPGRRSPSCSLQSVLVDAVSMRGCFLACATIAVQLDFTDASRLPAILGRRMAEGVLLDDTLESSPGLEGFLQRNRLPAVWLNQRRRVNAVCPDDAGAAGRVVAQLRALGHRRIAFVRMVPAADVLNDAASGGAAACLSGYEAAMCAADSAPEVLTFTGGWDSWSASQTERLRALIAVFRNPAHRPTAVITYHDGPILLALLQKIGVRVPEEISLVSFASPVPAPVEQLVSWVPVPMEEVGRRGVGMLFQLLDAGQMEAAAICLPYGEIASMHTVRKLK